jgi:tetratricopeptide (TPR) repeat protein
MHGTGARAMLRYGVVRALVATLGLLAATSARAEADSWAACAGGEPQYTIDQQIAGCTAYLATNPNDHFGLFNRGHSFEAKGLYDQAISDYNRAIALKPDFATAYEARANSYFQSRQYDWAIADYTRAIALMPGNAEPYGNRGNAFLALAKTDKAVADFQKALKLDPNNKSALNGLPLARAARTGGR